MMSQLTAPFPGQKPQTNSQVWAPAFSEPAMQARSPKPKIQMNAYMGDKGNSQEWAASNFEKVSQNLS